LGKISICYVPVTAAPLPPDAPYLIPEDTVSEYSDYSEYSVVASPIPIQFPKESPPASRCSSKEYIYTELIYLYIYIIYVAAGR